MGIYETNSLTFLQFLAINKPVGIILTLQESLLSLVKLDHFAR